MFWRPTDPLFVYFDCETTGLTVEEDSIIEIGAVVDRQQRRLWIEHDPKVAAESVLMVPTFNSTMRCLKELSPQIVCLTGITNKKVARAPFPNEVLRKFRSWLQAWSKVVERPILLVAHNAKFDVGFLKAELKRQFSHTNWLGGNIRFSCSLQCIRSAYGRERNLKLLDLARQYVKGFNGKQTHRALPDAKLLQSVVSSMPDPESLYNELLANRYY